MADQGRAEGMESDSRCGAALTNGQQCPANRYKDRGLTCGFHRGQPVVFGPHAPKQDADG